MAHERDDPTKVDRSLVVSLAAIGALLGFAWAIPPNVLARSIGTDSNRQLRDLLVGSGCVVADDRYDRWVALTQFERPYTLVISSAASELAGSGIFAPSLNLAFWNGSAWVNILADQVVGNATSGINGRLASTISAASSGAWCSVSTTASGRSGAS
jgi:hypothetical protein